MMKQVRSVIFLFFVVSVYTIQSAGDQSVDLKASLDTLKTNLEKLQKKLKLLKGKLDGLKGALEGKAPGSVSEVFSQEGKRVIQESKQASTIQEVVTSVAQTDSNTLSSQVESSSEKTVVEVAAEQVGMRTDVTADTATEFVEQVATKVGKPESKVDVAASVVSGYASQNTPEQVAEFASNVATKLTLNSSEKQNVMTSAATSFAKRNDVTLEQVDEVVKKTNEKISSSPSGQAVASVSVAEVYGTFAVQQAEKEAQKETPDVDRIVEQTNEVIKKLEENNSSEEEKKQVKRDIIKSVVSIDITHQDQLIDKLANGDADVKSDLNQELVDATIQQVQQLLVPFQKKEVQEQLGYRVGSEENVDTVISNIKRMRQEIRGTSETIKVEYGVGKSSLHFVAEQVAAQKNITVDEVVEVVNELEKTALNRIKHPDRNNTSVLESAVEGYVNGHNNVEEHIEFINKLSERKSLNEYEQGDLLARAMVAHAKKSDISTEEMLEQLKQLKDKYPDKVLDSNKNFHYKKALGQYAISSVNNILENEKSIIESDEDTHINKIIAWKEQFISTLNDQSAMPEQGRRDNPFEDELNKHIMKGCGMMDVTQQMILVGSLSQKDEAEESSSVEEQRLAQQIIDNIVTQGNNKQYQEKLEEIDSVKTTFQLSEENTISSLKSLVVNEVQKFNQADDVKNCIRLANNYLSDVSSKLLIAKEAINAFAQGTVEQQFNVMVDIFKNKDLGITNEEVSEIIYLGLKNACQLNNGDIKSFIQQAEQLKKHFGTEAARSIIDSLKPKLIAENFEVNITNKSEEEIKQNVEDVLRIIIEGYDFTGKIITGSFQGRKVLDRFIMSNPDLPANVAQEILFSESAVEVLECSVSQAPLALVTRESEELRKLIAMGIVTKKSIDAPFTIYNKLKIKRLFSYYNQYKLIDQLIKVYSSYEKINNDELKSHARKQYFNALARRTDLLINNLLFFSDPQKFDDNLNYLFQDDERETIYLVLRKFIESEEAFNHLIKQAKAKEPLGRCYDLSLGESEIKNATIYQHLYLQAALYDIPLHNTLKAHQPENDDITLVLTLKWAPVFKARMELPFYDAWVICALLSKNNIKKNSSWIEVSSQAKALFKGFTFDKSKIIKCGYGMQSSLSDESIKDVLEKLGKHPFKDEGSPKEPEGDSESKNIAEQDQQQEKIKLQLQHDKQKEKIDSVIAMVQQEAQKETPDVDHIVDQTNEVIKKLEEQNASEKEWAVKSQAIRGFVQADFNLQDQLINGLSGEHQEMKDKLNREALLANAQQAEDVDRVVTSYEHFQKKYDKSSEIKSSLIEETILAAVDSENISVSDYSKLINKFLQKDKSLMLPKRKDWPKTQEDDKSLLERLSKKVGSKKGITIEEANEYIKQNKKYCTVEGNERDKVFSALAEGYVHLNSDVDSQINFIKGLAHNNDIRYFDELSSLISSTLLEHVAHVHIPLEKMKEDIQTLITGLKEMAEELLGEKLKDPNEKESFDDYFNDLPNEAFARYAYHLTQGGVNQKFDDILFSQDIFKKKIPWKVKKEVLKGVLENSAGNSDLKDEINFIKKISDQNDQEELAVNAMRMIANQNKNTIEEQCRKITMLAREFNVNKDRVDFSTVENLISNYVQGLDRADDVFQMLEKFSKGLNGFIVDDEPIVAISMIKSFYKGDIDEQVLLLEKIVESDYADQYGKADLSDKLLIYTLENIFSQAKGDLQALEDKLTIFKNKWEKKLDFDIEKAFFIGKISSALSYFVLDIHNKHIEDIKKEVDAVIRLMKEHNASLFNFRYFIRNFIASFDSSWDFVKEATTINEVILREEILSIFEEEIATEGAAIFETLLNKYIDRTELFLRNGLATEAIVAIPLTFYDICKKKRITINDIYIDKLVELYEPYISNTPLGKKIKASCNKAMGWKIDPFVNLLLQAKKKNYYLDEYNDTGSALLLFSLIRFVTNEKLFNFLFSYPSAKALLEDRYTVQKDTGILGDFDIKNVKIIHVIHLCALSYNGIINNSLRKTIPSNDELTCTFINSVNEKLEKKLYFYDMWIVHYVLKELSNREETSKDRIDELLDRALNDGSMFNYKLKEQNIKAVIEEIGEFLDLLK